MRQLALALALPLALEAQLPSQSARDSIARLTAEDHRAMLDRLGIAALRPGPSGTESAPNAANYDEAKASPFTALPDPLVMDDGRRVRTAREWRRRRAELVAHLEREVYGRIPANVPTVAWRVTANDTGTIAGRRVVARQLLGHADNAAHPAITVDIPATLVLPADARGPVPVMILFSFGASLEQALGRAMPRPGMPAPTPGSDARATDQLIADGWGFVLLPPNAVQADHGAGLTQGIIGLTNRGRRRTPDEWGALRAWGWGASRVLDYLETDRAVDARRVGVEGVSRYGKAALVAMAFDERFAAVLVGSSGKGGATLHRRHFGEAVESLAGSGQYHWMAGNYLRYAAAAPASAARRITGLPADSHALLALCAPRLTFISYGIPERGDARWLDQRGSLMAAVAAGPVFRLLGARDLGLGDDYMAVQLPPVSAGPIGGQLAWRQHDGGHTDAPNWKHFLWWADLHFGRRYTAAPSVPAAPSTTAAAPVQQAPWPADRATPRTDSNSMLAHRQLLAKRTQGKIDLYFLGNSITRRWGATDYPQFLAHWDSTFRGWNAANFGWGADRVEHILWRIENGELDGVNPKVVVLLAGTNNVGQRAGGDAKVADVTRGLRALVDLVRRKAPTATIIVTGIFPRADNPSAAAEINAEIHRINANLAQMADGRAVRYVDVGDRLIDREGRLVEGMFMDALHPSLKGYQVWAEALTPLLTELLGPKKATDEAPPPTGDPSARRPD